MKTSKPRSSIKQSTRVQLTDDDWSFVGEMLRIAQTSMQYSLQAITDVWPNSPLVERLNQWMEHCADIRERIEQ
jgi:hypothetical protein